MPDPDCKTCKGTGTILVTDDDDVVMQPGKWYFHSIPAWYFIFCPDCMLND